MSQLRKYEECERKEAKKYSTSIRIKQDNGNLIRKLKADMWIFHFKNMRLVFFKKFSGSAMRTNADEEQNPRYVGLDDTPAGEDRLESASGKVVFSFSEKYHFPNKCAV